MPADVADVPLRCATFVLSGSVCASVCSLEGEHRGYGCPLLLSLPGSSEENIFVLGHCACLYQYTTKARASILSRGGSLGLALGLRKLQ